jgi:PAS domain S-box-containing protein
MSFLDVRTVMLSHVLTDAVCTAVLAFLWVQNRKRFAGTLYWVLDFAFQTAAVVLILLRGTVPAWVSMGVSNTLVVGGAFLGYVGLTRFLGKRIPQLHNYFLLAAFLAVHLYFVFAQPNLTARNLNVSLGLLVMCFQCVWLVLHQARGVMRRMTRWVGLIFGVFCLVSIIRIVVDLVKAPTTNDFFRTGAYDTVLLMSYQMLLILLTFSLALMINQRLLREIQAQEEKFTKAFRLSPYAITLTRPSDGQMLDVNDGFVAITGYALHEAIGKSTLDLRLWAREADRAAVIDELSQGVRIVGREAQFRKKSGELMTGLLSAEIITIDDQPCILSSISDITERKKAEAALQESERNLREAQEMAQLGRWIWDVRTGNVEWSERVFKIFHLDASTFTPHIDSIQAMSPWPEEHHRDKELIRRAMESRERGSYEQRFLRPDGSVGYYFSTFQGRYNDGGELVSLLGTVQDITERKLAEQALRRHAERLRNLHEVDQAILKAVQSPETIIQTALQHLCGLLRCARVSAGIFDKEKKEVRTIAILANGETTEQPGQLLEDEADMPSCINVPLLSARGRYGTLSIGWEDLRTISTEESEIAEEVAGQITLAIEQSQLLQEAKHFAAELGQRVAERTAQLQAANTELEAFSYSVSHDLRSPLRAIDGYTRILLEDHGSSLTAEGQRMCKVICQSATDMGGLIDDLLAFSRIGRVEMQRSPVDMAVMAKSAWEELATPENRERIDFHLGPLPVAVGDPGLLRHVWLNLLSNAVKFSFRKERARIEVSSETREGEVTYTVRDNGAGFDMAYAGKLFGVFQRLHSTKDFEGTGVGLAIVQRIIIRHGGRVWAEGKTESGAAFHFTIGKGE